MSNKKKKNEYENRNCHIGKTDFSIMKKDY